MNSTAITTSDGILKSVIGKGFLGTCVTVMIINPLYYLYRHGPGFIGSWKSAVDSQICVVLSGHTADQYFWDDAQNRYACQEMISKQFNSYITLLGIFFYFWMLVMFVFALFRATRQALEFILFFIVDQVKTTICKKKSSRSKDSTSRPFKKRKLEERITPSYKTIS